MLIHVSNSGLRKAIAICLQAYYILLYMSYRKLLQIAWLFMLSLHFSIIGSRVNSIASSLINWIVICMYSQVEYYFKSPLKIISNGLNEKVLDLHHSTFTSMIIVMLKPWFLWWLFGSDVYLSLKGIQTWQSMSVQNVFIKW